MSPVEILGVRIDNAGYDELMQRVDAYVASGQPHQIVTLNTEMLVAAHDDAAFRDTLNKADLVVADAAGLVLAALLLGQRLDERVTGSDGIYRLAAHCARCGYRPFFLGAAPGVAELVAERLVEANPGLQVAGTFAGSPHADDEDQVIACIRGAEPDLLFVAYGVPAEEKWIARNQVRLGVPVMLGVGGSFDFVAGVTKRAPRWMRRLGLEWLYRLIQEPWRWRRQLALPRFLVLVFKQRLMKDPVAGSSPRGQNNHDPVEER
jgi:N-acetylglucosaminyldiphosphoundecaprenol N-acetyl-beta-D-mannosaminyltransferase